MLSFSEKIKTLQNSNTAKYSIKFLFSTCNKLYNRKNFIYFYV